MRAVKFLGATALSLLIMATSGAAEQLRDSTGPAEFPPESFQGRQFVDSQGCVFVRAGVSGTTTWVPRVTRSRQVICGHAPTFARTRTATATVEVAPSSAPMNTVASTTTAPRLGNSAPTQATAQRNPQPTRSSGRRVVAQTTRVPEGYQAAWDDGRLNPNRGRGTALGQGQMELVWTNTVPRRLINRRTGREVRRVVLRREDVANNSRVTAPVTPDTTPAPAPTVSTRSAAPRPQQVVRSQRVQPVPQPVRATGAAAPASHRFVQVGTFADPANANRAAARLQQAGLPAQIGNVESRGRVLRVVLAGPFATQSNLDTALNRARGAGFSDAILRR